MNGNSGEVVLRGRRRHACGMAEFGSCQVLLDDTCQKYLNMNPRIAERRAAEQALPFPCYRAGSKKGPLLVDMNDLAAYLDDQRNSARKDWEAVNR